MKSGLRAARSVHVIPGSSDRFLKKAPELDADALMFDLEDGVAMREKEHARILVARALTLPDPERVRKSVRVNAIETNWMHLDVE